MTVDRARENTGQKITDEAKAGSKPDDRASSHQQPSWRGRGVMVFGLGGRAHARQRLRWVHIAGIAAALSINSLAVLYASLPPFARGPAPTSLESAPEIRDAITVEFVEATVVNPPKSPKSPEPPVPQRVTQRVSRQPPSAPVVSSPAPEIASAPVPSPRLRLNLSVSGAQAIEAAAQASAPMHDPKGAAALLYRRPAISYESTRFDKVWQSTSLADRARQSIFSYTRFCSLNDEMRQIRGCSPEERNADLSARSGNRVDTALRPGAAVD